MEKSTSVRGCSMCSYTSISEEDVKKHVLKLHKHHPRFFVYCNSCLRSYTKWNSYLKHIQRGCRSVRLEGSITNSTNNEQETDKSYLVSNGIGDTSEELSEPKEEQDDQREQAAYILSIKEKYGISQVAVDHIVESTKSLVRDVLARFVNHISSSNQVSPDALRYINEEAKKCSDNLFKNLSTSHLQKKFIKDNFGYVVCVYVYNVQL